MSWFQQNPEQGKLIFDFMPTQRAGQRSWMDGLVPMDDFVLAPGDDARRVMFLDVGGGAGHQSFALRTSHPELKGRVVVQEIDHMAALIDRAALQAHDVQAVAHDMFAGPCERGAIPLL